MAEDFGLTLVETEDLKTLLRYIYREEIQFPLTPKELARFGLQHCAESLLSHMRKLDAFGTRQVVVAVIAERMAQEEKDEKRRKAAERIRLIEAAEATDDAED